MPLDPRYPDTSNSLNRAVIADLPGIALPDDVRGKTGYGLVSTFALDNLIEAHSTDLGLARATSAFEKRESFFAALNQDTPTAAHIAQILGRNLGYLLMTLVRGDAVNRQARPDWNDSHWSLWGSLRTIHLGGGLVSGKMGTIMTHAAQTMLRDDASLRDFVVDIAPHPQHLALLGAARYASAGDSAFVFDFGGSFVKRGRAIYGDDGLERLELLPALPIGIREGDTPEPVFQRMIEVITATWETGTGDTIPVSIAGYVDANGQPLLTQGGLYMQLVHLSDDVPKMFSEAISKQLGQSATIKLLHDGSTAASFYSPQTHAAVIMIGTALGSGYAVERPGLRPVSANLSIVDGRA